MASGRFSRNTVLAGIFVLIIIGMFVLAIILISERGSWATATSKYTIRFELDEGADGLESGSPVKLGGVRVGSVTSVEFDPPPESGKEVTGILVGIAVDKRLKLYSDAQITLVRPLLGSNSALNIVRVMRDPASVPINPGARIEGELAPPGFVSKADYAKFQDVLDKVHDAVSVADRWIKDVDKDWPKPYEDVKATIASARAGVGEFETTMTDVRSKWDKWKVEFDESITLVRGRIDTITREAEDGVKRFKDLMASAQDLIDDNRAAIDQSVESIRSVLARFEKEDYAATIKKAQDVLAYAENIVRNADQTLTTQTPELKEAMTSARLAAQQLKLMMVEVRAAPWRLLYQPNKKELENELLYNSVRAYSDTLSEVRAAAEALDAATRSVAATPAGLAPSVDQDTIQALAAKLRESLSKSAEQERLFYDRWIREKPR